MTQYLSAIDGFLGLDGEDSAGSPEDAKVVVIPFGLEASVSYGSGTAKGPAAILKASHQVELFDEELWCEPFREFGGVATLKETKIAQPLTNAIDQLEHLVQSLLDADKFSFVLGGEHSLTAGAIRPFVRKYPDLAILHFDAHADLRDGYEGEHYSHASALRRVMDHPIDTLVSIGIRNISAGEIPFLEENRHRIHVHWAKDRQTWEPAAIVAPLKGRPIYVTFDLDGFDSSLMQATGTPEPGGLFWADAVSILRAAAGVSTIVGADVVELAPRPELHACDFLAAKLCYKLLSYALSGSR